ncbi:MAG TPA: TetR family transcriptional regulator C-terminal domain-containing protein [Actinoallomurus sp.]|nr:TetR family transcriptional regulator C-terminal domain-containing protein [Actinoallomurus sp.]
MPKRVDHELRRREIGEALLRIAGTRGLAAAGMRQVAAEAGVSLPLVQYYFGSKDELLLQALRYLGEQLWDRVQEAVRPLDPVMTAPRRVLEATLCAVLPLDEQSRRIMLAYNAYYTLAVTEPNPATRHALTHPDAMERLLAGSIRRAQRDGVLAGRDPQIIAAGLLALTNGLSLSVLSGQKDGDAARAVLADHLDRLVGSSAVGPEG